MFWSRIYFFVSTSINPPITSGQNIYKYIDKDGVVHFTDTPTDPKYEPSGLSESDQDRIIRRERQFQAVIEEIMEEFNNEYRAPESVQLCADAIQIIKAGTARPETEKSDTEFLDLIREAIFDLSRCRGPNRRLVYYCYSKRALAQIETARNLKGIPRVTYIKNVP